MPALSSRAALALATAMTTATISGPRMKLISTSAASSANAVVIRSWSPSRRGHIERRTDDHGGRPTAQSPASVQSTQVGAWPRSATNATRTTTWETTSGGRTGRGPKRSSNRPWNGVVIPSAAAYAPAATPAAPNEPVS
jgi:hypothetical protein